MARKKSYLPKADDQLVNWLNNLAAKISGYASKYGISNAEVSYIQAAALYFAYWFGVLDMIKGNVQKLTKWKNEIRDGLKAGGSPAVTPGDIAFTSPPAVEHGVLPFVRSIVNRIKAHQSYSETDGEDLKIVGADDDTDLSALKPLFHIDLKVGRPDLVWTKGITSGVKIRVNRNMSGTPVPIPVPDPMTFQFLATDTEPNYTDTYPLPPFGQSTVWAYIMVYMMGDEEVGEWSDPVLVTVKGIA